MSSAKSWRHAPWRTLITRCRLRKTAAGSGFQEPQRAAKDRQFPRWESRPPQVQPKVREILRRERLSSIQPDREVAGPGICGHFESGQRVGNLSDHSKKIDAEKSIKLYKYLLCYPKFYERRGDEHLRWESILQCDGRRFEAGL